MRKYINIILFIQCVLLLTVTCKAQDISVNQRKLNNLLEAGEFAQAQRLAENQTIVGDRNQFLGAVARRQAQNGNRHGALGSLGSMTSFGDQQYSNSLGSSASGQSGQAGQGGAPQADFDTLINLIKSTIEPLSWDDAGGSGTIQPFPGGVYIDRDGLVVRFDVNNSAELQVIRRGQFDGMFSEHGQDVREESSLRKVSLVRLQRELELLRAQGRDADVAMKNLAGIYKIQYVLVYPESGDIVIAGPAGQWTNDNDGRIVHHRTRRPTVKLDNLVELLRNAFSKDPTLGCSITPRADNLLKTQQYLKNAAGKPIVAGRTEQWLSGLRDSMGRQDVEVFGVNPQTHLAKTLVEADYHMKLIGMGLVPGVPGMNSYMDNLKQVAEKTGTPQSISMLRWWFTTNYNSLHATKDGQAFEIIGSGVKVLSENELIGKLGNRVATGKSDPLTQQFAIEFTKNFEQLSRQYPVYGELRNVFDLALIAMLIKSEDLHTRVQWNLDYFLNENGYRVVQAVSPTEVESVISHRLVGGKTVLAGVSGGVLLDPRVVVAEDNIVHDSYGILEAEHK
ncbi:MAG: DUF1598 domain-containing protein, partial [Planctomycetaceae bacterium]|nr:DUF1598 domain-containing protein [Planctomycetaceae bacterium]